MREGGGSNFEPLNQRKGFRPHAWFKEEGLTYDQFDPAASEDKLVEAVCPGNIYLLHAISSTNAQIMGRFINRVRDAGYEWGDLGEL